MLIAFGYAYPNKVVSFAGGESGENPYWVSYNQRADADGAFPKEGDSNVCTRTRFLNAIPNYTFFDFDQQYFVVANNRADADGATSKEMNAYGCTLDRYFGSISDYQFFLFFNTTWQSFENRANTDSAIARELSATDCASTKMYDITQI